MTDGTFACGGSPFFRTPSMAQFSQVKDLSRVFTAKCSEPQAAVSNDKRRGIDVYIPKANGKQRPLGISTVVNRVIQQSVAQILSRGYERYFSDHNHRFRPGRSCHTAMEQALKYLNGRYE